MKKVLITLTVMALCAMTALYAQETNSKTMIQKRIDYMKEHVQLSGKESQNFWKVYEEYLNAEMKAMEAYRKNLEKQEIKLGAPGTNKEIIEKLSDKQITYLQDQKFELRKTLLNLEVTYYKKYKAILTPRHLQDLYNAEYQYKRQMTAKRKDAPKKDDSTGHVNTGKKKR
jgi:uncharacterized protein YxeA